MSSEREQQEAGVQPKVVKISASKTEARKEASSLFCASSSIYTQGVSPFYLFGVTSPLRTEKHFLTQFCICSLCSQASKLHRVHSSVLARPQTLVANTVSAAQRSIKRFGGCTLQIIVYLLPHLWYSVSVRNVEGSLWTWSSWPSLGAKISSPRRPVRDPFEAVYATCLKKRRLE